MSTDRNQAEGGSPIPAFQAVRLCNEISAKKLGRWWDPSAWQCMGCARFSADIQHRCFNTAAGNRGCVLINKRWDAEVQSFRAA